MLSLRVAVLWLAGVACTVAALVVAAPALAARVDSTSVSHVTSDAAILEAQIDPLDEETTYRFEYLTQRQFDAQGGFEGPETTIVPRPDASLGVAESDERVFESIQSLEAGATYRYRVVAKSASGTTIGVEKTFATQHPVSSSGLALPDGRQWEMVTPQEKAGALIEGIGTEALAGGGVVQAAADGGAITYLASQPTETEPEGYDNQLQVIATRTPTGWESTDITPPHEAATTASVGQGNEYRFFSEDLSSAVVQPFGPFIPDTLAAEHEKPERINPRALAPEEASEQTPFLRALVDGGSTCVPAKGMHCYRPLVTGKEPYANVLEGTIFGHTGSESKPCPPAVICGPEFRGASPDARHVVVSSNTSLTTTSPPAQYLYEWTGSNPPSEQLQPVSVLPLPKATLVGGTLGYENEDARHAISEDGTRVFWTTASDNLYVRDLVKEQTLQLDFPEESPGEAQTKFQYASLDGSRAFYTARPPKSTDRELFECALVEVAGSLKCETTDLTPPPKGGTESAAVVGDVIGGSEDGSWIYFVANGLLENGGVPVAGAVHGTCGSNHTSGTCNLYVRHGGTTKLVAVISGEDASDWGITELGKPGELSQNTARVSPNGEWLTFMSLRELTGYDNHDGANGKPDEEVFVYDAAESAVICASCNPTGGRPVGVEYGGEGENMPLAKGEGTGTWERSTSIAADLPTWTSYRLTYARYQSRFLSNSGRLFFNARDALVPQDKNQTWDVYEWEPSGVGDCSSSAPGFEAPTDACVSLISSGTSAQESVFLDASEGGSEVFFLTTARLWPNYDFDNSYDIYDARECSSTSPCIPEPNVSATPSCDEVSMPCRPPATTQSSIFSEPGSAPVLGDGNVPPVDSVVMPKPPPTRAQLLAAALKSCHKKYSRAKKRRTACERQARKRYGTRGTARRSRAARSKRGTRR